MRKYSVCLFAFAAGIAATCKALEITGEYPIEVASGATKTIDEVITGTGYILKTGAGTLKLTNAANDFSGGVKVSAGTVSFDAVGSQGTGKLEIFDSGMLRFNAAGTFANAIDVASGATASWKIHFDKQVTLTGAITSAANLTFLNNSKTTCTVDATVSASGYFVRAAGVETHYVKTDFKQKVICDSVNQLVDWPNGLGAPRFFSTKNEFNKIYLSYSDFFCGAKGCIPENVVVEWNNPSSEVSRGAFNLYGFDQTINSLHSSVPANQAGLNVGYDDTDAATLTLKATQSDEACCCFLNKISLVYYAQNSSYTQKLTGRKHTTAGTFTVKNGTLQLNGATTAAKLSGLTVEGGCFDLNTTLADALVGLKALTVGSGATFKIASTAVTPFSVQYEMVAKFASDCILNWPSGTVLNVKELYIDDVRQPGGYYTHDSAGCGFIPEGVVIHAVEMDVTASGEVTIPDTVEGRDLVVLVPSGVTVTNTTAIGGKGRIVKSGTGTLVFNSANTYSGGTYVIGGTLHTTVGDSLGSGEVRVLGGGSATCRVLVEQLTTAELAIANDFVFEGKTTSSYRGLVIKLDKWSSSNFGVIRFTGSFKAQRDLYMTTTATGNNQWNDTARVVLEGPVDAAGYTLALDSHCGVQWKNAVKCSRFYSGELMALHRLSFLLFAAE